MLTKPKPSHPNWWPDGKWCYGSWDIAESLGNHVIRMLRTLNFDPEITQPNSSADGSAKEWYLANQQKGWFPINRDIVWPDPTRSRITIHEPEKKKFNIW